MINYRAILHHFIDFLGKLREKSLHEGAQVKFLKVSEQLKENIQMAYSKCLKAYVTVK